MPSALVWENVTKRVGSERLLVFDNANLEVKKGEFVAIVGPSGVGKTTMIMITAGILKPDSGKVVVAGERVDTMDRDKSAIFRRKKMGIVFQFFNLIPTLTVIENIALPLELNGVPHKEAKKRALDLLETIGLADKANKFPNTLSGGEQQRVAVLRAIIHKPEIVLADEPTGNLDEKNKSVVLDLFKRFNEEEGITILIATHDVELVSRYADRIIRIKNRRLIEVE